MAEWAWQRLEAHDRGERWPRWKRLCHESLDTVLRYHVERGEPLAMALDHIAAGIGFILLFEGEPVAAVPSHATIVRYLRREYDAAEQG